MVYSIEYAQIRCYNLSLEPADIYGGLRMKVMPIVNKMVKGLQPSGVKTPPRNTTNNQVFKEIVMIAVALQFLLEILNHRSIPQGIFLR